MREENEIKKMYEIKNIDMLIKKYAEEEQRKKVELRDRKINIILGLI